MPKIKIASASCNQTGQDWSNNLKNIYLAIDKAIEDGADFLCLEELTLTGYECGDNFAYTDNQKIQTLLQLVANYAANQNPNLVISIGHPWRFADKHLPPQTERRKNPIFNRLNLPFNVQSFISQGRIISMSAKRYLFNYERGYEKRHFEEWSDFFANQYHQGKEDAGHDGTISITLPELTLTKACGEIIHYQARNIPFGSPVVRVGNIHVVHEICEELWVGSRFDNSPDNSQYQWDNPIAEQMRAFDIQLVINPNGSPPEPDKIDKIKELVELNSSIIKPHVTVYTDGLGSSGSTFAQTGFRMMAQDGQLKAQGSRLSFKSMDYSSQVFEVNEATESNRIHANISHHFNDNPTPGINHTPAAWEELDNLKIAKDNLDEDLLKTSLTKRQLNEELRHEALWLFDYLRKNKLKGFTQAISGGADSAYNAAKVRIMIELAIFDLGIEGYLDALSYSEDEKSALLNAAEREENGNIIDILMEHTLTSVYLSTPNNSFATRQAAQTLIEGGIREDGTAFKGIGGKFYAYDIQPLVNQLAMLYSGISYDTLPKENIGELLNQFQSFLNLPSNLSQELLAEKMVQFNRQLNDIFDENPITGPILNTATPSHALTIENMQARIRQVIILMITNFEKGKIGIANPNLDEICNAYTSFGGDEHSGQIALNAHKPKHHQLAQMKMLEKGLLQNSSPIEGFYYILKNKPSAELLPKNTDGEVIQYDEDALGKTFLQSHIISYYMLYESNLDKDGRKNNPTEVFEKCCQHPAFAHETIDTVHDMVLLSYKNWAFAQHKIHAFPIAFTYGKNVDHQSSCRTPNISGNFQSELAQLCLEVIDKLANEKNMSLRALTGYDKNHLQTRVNVDSQLVQKMESAMWSADATDGRKRKITTLFKKIESREFKFDSGFLYRFFNSFSTWSHQGEQQNTPNSTANNKIK